MTSPVQRTTIFFLLVLALASLFWLLGALAPADLMPGLPVAALSFVCPGLAGLILTWREGGGRGAIAFLRRAFDVGRITHRGWLAAALLIPPGVAVLSWIGLRLAGAAIPAPQFSWMTAAALAVAFFVAATCEELGWSGYATDPLTERWGLLRGALILGSVWAAFHFVPLMQAHRSAAWIAWWTLGTLSMRVIMVWLYVRAGRSVFAASLFHMAANLAWQLYPIRGSYFDPRVHGLIMAALALAAVAIWRTPATSRPVR